MKKKILVVDNHPVILKFMDGLLSKEGYQVLTAENGLSALDILKTCTPDIVFIDLIMPNIGGKKLCQIIREMPRLKDVYLVILSAVAAEEEISIAELGVNAYIAKGPFDKMAKHILAVLDQLDQGSSDLPEEIIGLNSVYPREITRELLSVKRHFEIVLESMSEGILEITREERVIYANSSALSLINMAEKKILGSKFIGLFAETDRQGIKELLGKVNTTQQRIIKDIPCMLNDKQVELNILPIDDDEHMIFVILNDVSERKRLEDQLLIAQKMEAIATLAGGIAHDFNNLLMGVQGNASLMLLDIGEKHPHSERLINIEKLVQSGAKLTSQLLGYARCGRYEVKPINLNQLVEETSETFGRTRKEIAIRQELALDLSAIEADQGQIEQVLFNLYINAADAMPCGGNLILKTVNLTHEDIKGKVYDPKPGKYVLLTVTDTGSGMDKETMRRIFDPFFTTKEMGRGTGLGLASVYGIIKGHGGYIDVDSREGDGSIFKVCLPATEKEIPKTVKTSEEILRGTETILLVDDEEIILKVGRELLGVMGYRVLTAGNGKETIEVYKKYQNTIDMVVLDMVMPDMGGSEAYDRLKEINPDIKVLLSSGYSIEGEATDILERGCSGFIQKPFNMKQLSESIRAVLEGNK